MGERERDWPLTLILTTKKANIGTKLKVRDMYVSMLLYVWFFFVICVGLCLHKIFKNYFLVVYIMYE